jgi:hypothetical protein
MGRRWSLTASRQRPAKMPPPLVAGLALWLHWDPGCLPILVLGLKRDRRSLTPPPAVEAQDIPPWRFRWTPYIVQPNSYRSFEGAPSAHPEPAAEVMFQSPPSPFQYQHVPAVKHFVHEVYRVRGDALRGLQQLDGRFIAQPNGDASLSLREEPRPVHNFPHYRTNVRPVEPVGVP